MNKSKHKKLEEYLIFRLVLIIKVIVFIENYKL